MNSEVIRTNILPCGGKWASAREARGKDREEELSPSNDPDPPKPWAGTDGQGQA